MYARQLADEFRIYLILYVDDMLIAGSNKAEIRKLKRNLCDKFTLKELGQARHIVGMRIERNRKTMTLRFSQSDYIQKMLKREANTNPASDDNPIINRDSPPTGLVEKEERKKDILTSSKAKIGP